MIPIQLPLKKIKEIDVVLQYIQRQENNSFLKFLQKDFGNCKDKLVCITYIVYVPICRQIAIFIITRCSLFCEFILWGFLFNNFLVIKVSATLKVSLTVG